MGRETQSDRLNRSLKDAPMLSNRVKSGDLDAPDVIDRLATGPISETAADAWIRIDLLGASRRRYADDADISPWTVDDRRDNAQDDAHDAVETVRALLDLDIIDPAHLGIEDRGQETPTEDANPTNDAPELAVVRVDDEEDEQDDAEIEGWPALLTIDSVIKLKRSTDLGAATIMLHEPTDDEIAQADAAIKEADHTAVGANWFADETRLQIRTKGNDTWGDETPTDESASDDDLSDHDAEPTEGTEHDADDDSDDAGDETSAQETTPTPDTETDTRDDESESARESDISTDTDETTDRDEDADSSPHEDETDGHDCEHCGETFETPAALGGHSRYCDE